MEACASAHYWAREIVALAAKHRLPAIYPYRRFAEESGLAAYGVDTFEQMRSAASYVDRILKGAKPGDLPVQTPTKYTLIINMKTGKALDLKVPSGLLAEMQTRWSSRPILHRAIAADAHGSCWPGATLHDAHRHVANRGTRHEGDLTQAT